MPPVSEQTTSVKLKDALGNKVKERLDDWRDDNNDHILVNMLTKSISICSKYSLYNPEGKWRVMVQAVGRALTGKCKKEWLKLEANTTNWA